jgi:hypothetical protein
MSDFTLWQQLHSEWVLAKTGHDDAQKMVDDQMQNFLQGNGGPPSRKMQDRVTLLGRERLQARAELDQFIYERTAKSTVE